MTTLRRWTTLLLAVSLCGYFAAVNAQDKSTNTTKDVPADDKGTEDSTKSPSETGPDVSYKSAATVDFAAELGLSFPSLLTIGSRIEQCRSINPDPFGLANAAKELAAAEKLSGGNASITAEQLMAEAVEMAKVRENSIELKAVAMLVGDEKVQTELTDLATRAANDEKKRSEQVKAGVVTRGITSALIVDNDSHQRVSIYYNRRYLGSVRAHGHRHFRVHDHSKHFDLRAVGSNGTVWRRHLHGDRSKYVWKLRSQRRPIVRLPSRVRNLHTHVRGHHVDVEWGRATNAVSYEVQVYDKRAGQALRNLWKRGVRRTEIHFEAQRHNTVYQIFVRGVNSRGLPNDRGSLWSKTEVFVR